MQFYVSKDGQQYGPYTAEQLEAYLESGHFTIEDHAICEGWDQWVRLETLVEQGEQTQSPQASKSQACHEPAKTESLQAAEPPPDGKLEQAKTSVDQKTKKSILCKRPFVVISASVAGLAFVGILLFFFLKKEERPKESLADSSPDEPTATSDAGIAEKNESKEKAEQEARDREALKLKEAESLKEAKEKAEAEKQAKRKAEEEARRSGTRLKLNPKSTDGFNRITIHLTEKMEDEAEDSSSWRGAIKGAEHFRFWPPFWSVFKKGDLENNGVPAVLLFSLGKDSGISSKPNESRGKMVLDLRRLKVERKTIEIDVNCSIDGTELLLRLSPNSHERVGVSIENKESNPFAWEGAEKLSGRRRAFLKNVNAKLLEQAMEEPSWKESLSSYLEKDPFEDLLAPEIQNVPARLGEVPFFRKANFSRALRSLAADKKAEEEKHEKFKVRQDVILLLNNFSKELMLEKELSLAKMISPTPEGKAVEFLRKACREITRKHHLRLDEKIFVRKSPADCIASIHDLSENFVGKMVQSQFKRDLESIANRIIRAEAKLEKALQEEIDYEGEKDPTQKQLEEFKRNKLKDDVLKAKEDLAEKQQATTEFFEMKELGEVPEITKVDLVVKEIETKLTEKTKLILGNVHEQLSPHANGLASAFGKPGPLPKSETLAKSNLLESFVSHQEEMMQATIELIEEYPIEYVYEGHVALRLTQLSPE